MKHSKADLIAELERLADETTGGPTIQQMREEGKHSVSTYYERFGSWQDALAAAGFEPRSPETAVDRTALLDELQRLADEHETQSISATAMEENGKFSEATYRREFGSWNAAVKAAGLLPLTQDTRIPETALLDELRRLSDDDGVAPSFDQMDTEGEYGASTYVRRFGSWGDAVQAAGLTPRSEANSITDSTLIAELTRLATELDETPTTRQMDEHGAYSSTTYQRHFGSWHAAIEAVFEQE
jgi:hypothetical protein